MGSIDFIDEVGREWAHASRYRALEDENAALRKRVEELEREARFFEHESDEWHARTGISREDGRFLLNLTRALLDSQGELMERVGNEECNCEVANGKTTWECPRCKVLDRAERIRKGEV